jgi:hypothetical protein
MPITRFFIALVAIGMLGVHFTGWTFFAGLGAISLFIGFFVFFIEGLGFLSGAASFFSRLGGK